MNLLLILARAIADSFRGPVAPDGVSEELWARREQYRWAMKERQESGMYRLWV